MATKKTDTKTNGKHPAVLVTTKHRGVFFGYLASDPTSEKVKLERVRNVLYWTTDARGFLGLAADGPAKGSRVGPAAPSATLYEITSVVECSEQAAARFEDAPWS